VAEHAARIRAVLRREKHTSSKDMKVMPEDVKAMSEVKAMPEWTLIVVDNLPAGVTNRGPCRNPECDHGTGGKSPKQAGRYVRDLRCC